MVVEVCKWCGDVTPSLKGCGWWGCLVDREGNKGDADVPLERDEIWIALSSM